jgi:methyltransferase (TIGR00027 family)
VQSGQPSRTAWAAAAHRAAHQVLEQGCIFADPLALRILGQDAETVARDAAQHPSRRGMRLFIAARTRFAEDALAAALQNGVTQLVVLGAGLDTFAYRSHYAARLLIFEVDHPATQAWKRQRLADAAISTPSTLIYAPIDFERETLPEGLAAAKFDPAQQTFFTWLGVVPYLTEEAIRSTLRFIASLPNGSHVVFDYSDPPHTLTPEQRAYHDRRAARVESIGESWVTHFEADHLRQELLAIGFTEVVDLGPQKIAARYIPELIGKRPDRGGHILRASTTNL